MNSPARAVGIALVALATLGQTVPPAVRYLGQTPPGLTPVRFAPGIVSTSAIEINAAFRPDFREFFFARQVDGVFTLFRSTLAGTKWSEPAALPIFPGGAPGVAVDMAFSPDGRELFFMGRFKEGLQPTEAPIDIWVTRQREGRWASAELVTDVSSEVSDIYPVVVADGSLYFTSNRSGGHGQSDIYRAQRRPDGRFDTPVNIGSPPNSIEGEGDTFVSPDESYLILTSRREGGAGFGDLYVSFRTSDKSWGPAISLGPAINTADQEFCPMVTPDGRYLFFSRTYGGGTWATTKDADVFWVDIAVIERLRR